MLIRSRRLRWGTLLGLAAVCVMLIRPARTWVDQSVVAPWLDPHLSVAQVHVHANRSLVELREVEWRSTSGSPQIAVMADRAWLAYSAEPLLDKRFHLPRVLLEDAHMQLLESPAPCSLQGASVWQTALVERMRTLEWHDIAQEFATFLSNDERPRNWLERMDRWLARSKELTNQASSLKQEATATTNLLRLTADQQHKLAQLAAIADEQEKIPGQFHSLEQLVLATINRVDERLALDTERLDAQVKRQVDDQQLISELAHQLVRAAASDSWKVMESYARVSDCIARSEVGTLSHAETIDVRAPNLPLVQLSEVVVAGNFTQADTSTPFQILGEYQMFQRADRQLDRRSVWQVDFASPLRQIVIVVAHRPNSQNVNDLQLSLTADGRPTERCMVLTSDGSTLEGEYTLAPENWPSTYAAQAEAPLRLQVSGTWQQVKFEMMDPLPDWLLAITRERMEEELFDAREKLAADLRLHAEKKLQQLQGVAALLTVQAALTTQDSEQIATLAGDLEQHFEELNSENATEVEFARRTGSRLR